MESGSSGSMQSSSGGDDEYDSRGESISAFLNSNPNHSHIGEGNIPGLQPRQHQLQQFQMGNIHSPSMFDPTMSNFFDPMSVRGPNPVLNLDSTIAWSKSPRPDPNCTNDHLGVFELAPMQLQPLLGYNSQGQGRGGGPGPPSFPVLSESEGLKQLGSISGSAANEHIPITEINTAAAANNVVSSGNTIPRNPKKRSRASRRAPTTVLTTDTSNFRAMVQEFTGIPAPPFTAPPFQRSRLGLDLFGSGSGAPPYLLRPFAQKIQPLVPPFTPPSSASSSFPTSVIEALSSTTAGNNIANADLGILKSPPGLLNQSTPNQVLDFQSLFQAPGQKYPIPGSSIFPEKTLGSSDNPGIDDHNPHMKLGMLEEFGLGHGHVSTQLQAGLPNLESSDRTLSETNNNNDDNPHPNWHGDGGAANDISNGQGMSRPLGDNFGRIVNNHRGSRSTGGARGDGMIESWVCSSD